MYELLVCQNGRKISSRQVVHDIKIIDANVEKEKEDDDEDDEKRVQRSLQANNVIRCFVYYCCCFFSQYFRSSFFYMRTHTLTNIRFNNECLILTNLLYIHKPRTYLLTMCIVFENIVCDSLSLSCSLRLPSHTPNCQYFAHTK